jgi:hypothetical protein
MWFVSIHKSSEDGGGYTVITQDSEHFARQLNVQNSVIIDFIPVRGGMVVLSGLGFEKNREFDKAYIEKEIRKGQKRSKGVRHG